MAHLLPALAILPILVTPAAADAATGTQAPPARVDPAPAAAAETDEDRGVDIPPAEGDEQWHLGVMPLPADGGQPPSHAFLFLSLRKDCATPRSFRIVFTPDTGGAIPKQGALLSRQPQGERCFDGLATVFPEGTADALAKAARVTVTMPGATIELGEAQLAFVRTALTRRAAPKAPGGNDPATLSDGETPAPADPARRADAEQALQLLDQTLTLYSAGRMKDARKSAEASLAAAERGFGPEHGAVATHLLTLGRIIRRLGDDDTALAHYRRAIAILEPGGPSMTLGVALDNMGRIYQDRKDYDGGIAVTTRAIDILAAALGPEDEHVAITTNNLAMLWHAKGDPIRAAEACDRAVAILTRTLGAGHPRLRPFLEDQKMLRKRADRQ